MEAKKYYFLESKNNVADLYIFGDIISWPWSESDVSASGIVKELQSLEVSEINVHINSYGGEVAEGLAIYNTLKNSDMKVTTVCDGFACSAASVIFMAGDERVINEASLLMIHNAWTYTSGNAEELRKAAEDLDKITQASVNAYMSRVSISEDKVRELMDNESWITADEAVEYGFATKTEKNDDDGIKQSAFGIIRNAVTKTEIAPVQQAELVVDAHALAEEVENKLSTMFETLQTPKQKHKDSTGWGIFLKEEIKNEN